MQGGCSRQAALAQKNKAKLFCFMHTQHNTKTRTQKFYIFRQLKLYIFFTNQIIIMFSDIAVLNSDTYINTRPRHSTPHERCLKLCTSSLLNELQKKFRQEFHLIFQIYNPATRVQFKYINSDNIFMCACVCLYEEN
jgi:hypothetical protein